MPLPNTLTEMGCQLIIKQRAINAGFQPRGEEMLVKELEHAGCSPTSIRLLEPEWTWFAPDPDWPNQWEPYWAWVLNAVGERRAS